MQLLVVGNWTRFVKRRAKPQVASLHDSCVAWMINAVVGIATLVLLVGAGVGIFLVAAETVAP